MSENPQQWNEIISVKEWKEWWRLSLDFVAFEKAMSEWKIDPANSVRLIDWVSKSIDSINDLLASNQPEKWLLTWLWNFLKWDEDQQLKSQMDQLAKKFNDTIWSYMNKEQLADAELIQWLQEMKNLPQQPEFAILFNKNSEDKNEPNLVVQSIENGHLWRVVSAAAQARDKAVEEAGWI